jgi:hypothetical protein
MQFIFNHDTNALLPFLLATGKYMQEQLLPAGCNAEAVLNRCKFILTELCTNGIKHAGVPASTFNFYIEDAHLIIERRDKGTQFHPRINGKTMPLPMPASVDIITITEDDINRLNLQRIHDYSIRLYVEEIPSKNDFAQQTINEHFGLIIICSSSDSFVYSYNAEEGVNIFTASIKI